MCQSFFFHFMHLYILAYLSPTGDYGPLWDQGTVVPDPIAYCTLQQNTLLELLILLCCTVLKSMQETANGILLVTM